MWRGRTEIIAAEFHGGFKTKGSVNTTAPRYQTAKTFEFRACPVWLAQMAATTQAKAVPQGPACTAVSALEAVAHAVNRPDALTAGTCLFQFAAQVFDVAVHGTFGDGAAVALQQV